MIMFNNDRSEKEIQIISRNAKKAGISFNDKLIEIAGSEEDLKKLFSSTDRKLKKERLELEQQRIEFAKKQEELDRLKIANQKEIEENKRQKEINKQQKKRNRGTKS